MEDWAGVKDPSQGLAWVAMVEFDEVRHGLTWLEGDQGQADVTGERQIERSGGFTMAVPILLPGGLDAPVVQGGSREKSKLQ